MTRTSLPGSSPDSRVDRRLFVGGGSAALVATALWLRVTMGTQRAGSEAPPTSDATGETPPGDQPWVAPGDLSAPPEVTAAALFVGSVGSGQVLLARDADTPRAPASTIKLAVALTVVDTFADLDQVVVIDAEDEVDQWLYSNAQLAAGDEVTVRDLLYGLLLPSGNDAAKALARAGGLALDAGSDDPTATFLAAVNARVASLGATATTVRHPAGVDTDGQATTARDLATIMAAVLADEMLATVIATPGYDMAVGGPASRVVTLTNTNQLLGTDGIVGGKTGTTDEAEACLVTAVLTADDDRVVVVVLGCEREMDDQGLLVADRRYDDTLALIDATVGLTATSAEPSADIVIPVSG